ncbi:hypothetical protein L9F63_016427 [Diploptera punctata]|uniref:Uncharacterized protein n=1 Tax=Diploptera punctata TaxID=6984 RepID=A0AAD8A0U9_DIPPU|nr:hypothetical protein L9F63_016427 [Diploptera punctata]
MKKIIALILLLHISCIFCILNIPIRNNNLDEEISKSILEISRRYFSKTSHIFMQSLSMENGDFGTRGRYNNVYILAKLHEKLEIPVIMYIYMDYMMWNIHKPEESQVLVFILPKTSIKIQLRLFVDFIFKTYMDILYPNMHIVIVSPSIPATHAEKLHIADVVLSIIWYCLREVNTIYITPRDTYINYSNILEVYSWFPDKQPKECLKNMYRPKITRIALWIPKRSNFTHHLFPSKDIKDMKNCELLVILSNMPPYLMKQENNKVSGYFPEILETLSKTNNIKLKYVFSRKNERNRYDIVLPVVLEPNAYSKYRRYLTYPLFIFSDSWYVPIIPISKWQSIIRIFSVEMWIIVVAAYLMGATTFWLLKDGNDLVKSFIDTLRTLLCFGIPVNYQGALSTIFFSLWLLFCLQINTAYQSSLIGFMEEPGIYPPITDTDELESSGFVKESSIYFGNSYIYSTGDNVSAKIPHCGNIENCLYRMIQYKKTATLGPTIFTDMLLTYMSIGKKIPDIISLKPDISTTHYAAIVELGPFLTKRFDHITSSLFSAGVIVYQHRHLHHIAKNVVRKKFTSKEKLFAITLSHVQGPFYLLVMGLILTFIVFLTELLLKAYGNRKCN